MSVTLQPHPDLTQSQRSAALAEVLLKRPAQWPLIERAAAVAPRNEAASVAKLPRGRHRAPDTYAKAKLMLAIAAVVNTAFGITVALTDWPRIPAATAVQYIAIGALAVGGWAALELLRLVVRR